MINVGKEDSSTLFIDDMGTYCLKERLDRAVVSSKGKTATDTSRFDSKGSIAEWYPIARSTGCEWNRFK
jgi:hypothetical protein